MEGQDAPGRLYRYRFGTAEFDELRFELRVNGLPIDVETRPLEVLAELLHRAPDSVTLADLRLRVWKLPSLTDKDIEQRIFNALSKLRKALGVDNREHIVKIASGGYRINGQIERIVAGKGVVSKLEFRPNMRVPGREAFILDRRLGLSANSEVWLARNAKTEAVRVFKFALNGEQLALLKREATVSRLLRETLGHRDDFARILEWNFEEEPYFLECEYGGENLAEWAEQEGRLSSTTEAERIELFLNIADTVAAAHGVGVLHKDIKPANVLVSGQAGALQIRLTDFGVARILEPERLEQLGITRLGLTVTQVGSDSSGTPLYLAPELLVGHPPTVRSDVYSLGVLLYQLLVADFRKSMAPGWERDISDELLREDLAQAVDGNPSRRLGSATELSGLLRSREQRREQVRMLRDSEARARLAQQAADRAHALRPYLYGLVGLLVAGLMTTGWLYLRAENARRDAERQARRLEAVNEFYNREVLSLGDPISAAREDNPRIRDVLASAGEQVEAFFSDDAESKAAVYDALGQVFHGLGDYPRAVQHYQRAVDYAASSGGLASRMALQSQYQLATSLASAGRTDDARRVLEEADAAAARTADTGPQLAITAASAWGIYYQVQIQPDKVIEYMSRALELQMRYAPERADRLQAGRSTLADAYMRTGQYAAAEAQLLPLVERQPPFQDSNPVLHATAQSMLGQIKTYRHELDAAEHHLQAAYQTFVTAAGPHSARTLVVLSSLAEVRQLRGDFHGAAEALREVHQGFVDTQGEESIYALFTLTGLSGAEYLAGRHQETLQLLDRALPTMEQALGIHHPATETSTFWLAAALLERQGAGDVERAGTLLAQVTAEGLNAGAPSEHWPAMLAALHAAVDLAAGPDDGARARLETIAHELEQKQAGPLWTALVSRLTRAATRNRTA